MKPVVDRIEKDYLDDLIVIRLNIQEEMTRGLADKYGFEFTPTFIYFDALGVEQFRSVGSLDTNKIKKALDK